MSPGADSDSRSGMGLCLSGGGFRATLFHLGALRRLNELGVIAKLETVSSVSGGSITAAALATALASGTPLDWDRDVVAPLRAFTSRDRRTAAVFARLLPWNWFRSDTGVRVLERSYRAHLTSLRLTALPQRPSFVLCATDMQFGVNWIFEGDRVGDFQAGYASPPAEWSLALAVACSSCFPPIFNPRKLRLDPVRFVGGRYPAGRRRDGLVRGMRLTDGGDYDNLGLEPVWKSHQVVLVSDGGAPFDVSEDRGLFWRVERYAAIAQNQAHAVRVRWLIDSYKSNEFSGAYWGVGSAPSSYDTSYPGYSKALATDVISRIRTDLDAFSDAEAAVLENHGYWLAEAALQKHVPDLISPPPGAPPARAPHPDWMDETKVRAALRDSNRRQIPFGRRGGGGGGGG
jgi:NTE family protein